MRTLLLLLSLCYSSVSLANHLLEGFTAEYEVSKNDTVLGISKRQLVIREQGKKLDYASTTYPTGIIALFVKDRFIEHSQMQLGTDGIKPLQYEYQRSGGKKELTFLAKFNWQTNQIQMSNQPEPQALLKDSHDLLSFQLAIMHGLSLGKRAFHFQVVDHKRIQLQQLTSTQSLTIDSSQGLLDIVQLKHHADKSRYRFTFWCAKQLHYFPIKVIKHEADGDVIQLSLKRFNKKAFSIKEP